MPEIIPITGDMEWLAPIRAMAGGSNAVSAEAQAVREMAANAVRFVEQSRALFGAKAEAIARLLSLANEYQAEQATLDLSSVALAERFLHALPDDFPLPEFSVEPDGVISLDWIESCHRLFSLSMNPSGRFAYAWLDGTDKGHGVARFDGRQVPRRILEGIAAIFKNGTATLRAA